MATEMNEMAQEAIWLRNPRTGMVNLVVHPETMRRCLSEGHTVVSDPQVPVPADTPTNAPTSPVAPDPDAQAAVQQAQIETTVARNNAAREGFGVAPVQPPAKPERATRRKGA